MINLLPCPFCACSNVIYTFCGSQGYIECNECGTQGPCDERAADPICDFGAACDAWNRRAALAQPEPQGLEPTDDEIMELMPQQMRDDLANAARALAGFDRATVAATGAMRIILNRHAVDHARAVLAHWALPVPKSEVSQ